MLYNLATKFIFALDAEKAHRLAISALKLSPIVNKPFKDSRLSQNICGINFPTPIGLAPGFDKNAEVPREIMAMGFGYVEIGTVTPFAQLGNDKPRLFRLTQDRAVINRMGFNNDGHVKVLERVKRARQNGLSAPLGINIGANKDSGDRVNDYVQGVQIMAPYADYLTVNISSPNTPGLRDLQGSEQLNILLAAVHQARQSAEENGKKCPIFLKIAPDLMAEDIQDIYNAALAHHVDALIISNTTISRPNLSSKYSGEAGGLSGAPLKQLALQRLRDFYALSQGGIPLIGVGGIENAQDVIDRMRAGASLVQIYSALVFHGPYLAKKIADDLLAYMDAHQMDHLSQIIGTDA
ncbi:dihydroorotate dehydrogenase (quinone) [Sphingorhabdus lutea]|uniref:Dihydroorotate dehydrogenase (quinone) n=1 Tax=Sphingorhabdus lutea TaxID=1913578 RepID=A0A1L3JDS6_9SPHN|nr:quinone-dependent dihydroorotate dehydrogenase [Sphingorhabdus lutea]APG63203.1 dihydroorotate dehydrogenase (quinone) [Sphingorhabdus lutea]